jgi:truncated hemoglobin YjbI
MSTEGTTRKRRRAGDLKPNPEMWEALKRGPGLTEILTNFYTHVYADERLAHFFEGTTIDRAIQKQYSYLTQIFTGERVYFGERPRNAHHWMVISDELFDYREELMERCLREYGLPEHLVKAWRKVEEVFRKQIVKSEPVPKKIRGVALPLEGYGAIDLSVGCLCDECSGQMNPGLRVRYHLRTGRTFCPECFAKIEEPKQVSA